MQPANEEETTPSARGAAAYPTGARRWCTGDTLTRTATQSAPGCRRAPGARARTSCSHRLPTLRWPSKATAAHRCRCRHPRLAIMGRGAWISVWVRGTRAGGDLFGVRMGSGGCTEYLRRAGSLARTGTQWCRCARRTGQLLAPARRSARAVPAPLLPPHPGSEKHL